MNERKMPRRVRLGASAVSASLAVVASGLLSSCGGGGTGNAQDSGVNKTYLSVQASDAEGDALQYQWRVSAGTVENRNASTTVWTMPDGPGLHFAYVTVSDGKGGYVEQQYGVASDTLGTTAAVRAATSHVAPVVSDFAGTALRLRFQSADATTFAPPAGGPAVSRLVYLPDVQVQVIQNAGGATVFSGLSDLSGEVSLPKLPSGQAYTVMCASSPNVALANCGSFAGDVVANVVPASPNLDAGRNLRLFGHIGLADGGVCGRQSEYFGAQSAASVQVRLADGTPLTSVVRVNRFGDYAIDASVPVAASLKLQVQCESYAKTLDVPAAPGAVGYNRAQPVELSHQVPNNRPVIVKMVANSGDGNVRGAMVQIEEPGQVSAGLPGALQFLSYKGFDTALSACMYYRSLGAVGGCDAQGRMIDPISFEDWRRQKHFKPYDATLTEASANYVNRMDLNLVRRMVATKIADNDIAFYVCNHPGPLGSSQAEVDQVLATGLADLKRVACVAMEWSTTPGVNGGLPFTKFLTFGPDGSLLPSINLDGRGEKYMPGTCVACHGGTQYNGRFPSTGNPSPFLGAGFLPFDTGNYLFGSGAGLTEADQSGQIHALNKLVLATQAPGVTSLSDLMEGWYPNGTDTLNKSYVPLVWQQADVATPGAARFYREVVGGVCRTCHVAMGPGFNWDTTLLSPGRASVQVCGGKEDIARNASMPNALISRDRVAERIKADPNLVAVMEHFLGCSSPSPDPAYPKR